MRPVKGTYPVYFDHYIPLVKEEDLVTALKQNWHEVSDLFKSVPDSHGNYAYAENKWTIKQVLCHLIDTERIFAYRALRFARKDPQPLLSYDENTYAAAAELDHRGIKDLLEEWEVVRRSSLLLFTNFGEKTLLLSGKMASGEATVLSLGFIICGHATHHLNVIRERYLENNYQKLKN